MSKIAGRPWFLVYLLPLIILVAYAVTFATGFVPVTPGTGPIGPGYGFPLPYKFASCEISPCPIFNWYAFGLDVLFFIALQYFLIISYSIHIGRLPGRPSLRQLLGASPLGVAFKLALLGGILMVIVPVGIFPFQPAGGACQHPSPCETQLDNWHLAYDVMMTIWIFSGLITIFVAATLGLLGYLGHHLLGAIMLGLATVHLTGLGVFLSSGLNVPFQIGQDQLPLIAAGILIGPLLVFGAGFRLNLLITGAISPDPNR